MKRKSAQKHSSRRKRNSNQNSSFFIRYIGIAFLVVVLAIIGNHTPNRLNLLNVLGESTGEGGSPPPADAPAQQSQPQPESQQQSQPQQQPQEQQAQQQSQPQQPPQDQQQPQQQQNTQQTQPQTQYQQYQPQQQYQQYQQTQQSNQQPYQPRNAQEQRQMQQYQQQNVGNSNFGTGKNSSGLNQNSPQQDSQNAGQQNNFGNSPQQGQQQQFTQQQYEQIRQQYEQIQQQWQQEAEKNGFQIQPAPSGTQPFSHTNFFSGQSNQTGNQNTQSNSANSNQSFQALPSLNAFPTIRGNFEVASFGNNEQVNLNDANTKIQLGSQNSNLSLKAIKSDGTQIQIDHAAFEKIKAAIKLETGSEITQKQDLFVMKRGEVQAQTTFPISFNVATKTFTVQTPNGEKEVNVLPDQAVEKLLQNKVFSSIATTSTSQDGSGTSNTPEIALTELDNQAVYQVEGTSQERFLGFIPVSIAKTTYVSAQTGDLVSTNQNPFSRILDLVSF